MNREGTPLNVLVWLADGESRDSAYALGDLPKYRPAGVIARTSSRLEVQAEAGTGWGHDEPAH